MYNIGTVTTTANSPKITGTGTRWKDNTTLISVGQVVLIENGSNLLINSIYSIESNTALTLAFPISAKLTNAKYIILTTMIDSISDGVNKATAIAIASEVYTDILNQWMTAQGTIDVELPTGQKIKLRTVAEMDKQLDGKFDKTGGSVTGGVTSGGTLQSNNGRVITHVEGGCGIQFDATGDIAKIRSRQKGGSWFDHTIPETAGTLMQLGDLGWGGYSDNNLTTDQAGITKFLQNRTTPSQMHRNNVTTKYGVAYATNTYLKCGNTWMNISVGYLNGVMTIAAGNETVESVSTVYSTVNTTKDSNGNLKAASPVVKLFTDDIELNEESEGVEMEHLGIGHYLIKGVVGFNADGAWGINNGFVIPQDHNGKNMVLIDYEVRPDGDIEVFVFHQQNADMPERFQNKRIKHFDEEGVPVYFENYEPCDVPESRWIDMRVEMPPNSIYNQKQAEAERLAKLEVERLAQEEAKRAAEEAERVDQEVE
ncbi:hypothetical protein QDQ39_02105 [Providencia rettgeri]|uniref:phage tail fiber protein n=1 Tax=Providencia rettgeri TaxID=587 RepID=UPI002448DF69|nr:hypothetical protein [Providencia rettgeri]MDH2394596.1 hypothetical protein [Providencia rettgeri]